MHALGKSQPQVARDQQLAGPCTEQGQHSLACRRGRLQHNSRFAGKGRVPRFRDEDPVRTDTGRSTQNLSSNRIVSGVRDRDRDVARLHQRRLDGGRLQARMKPRRQVPRLTKSESAAHRG